MLSKFEPRTSLTCLSKSNLDKWHHKGSLTTTKNWLVHVKSGFVQVWLGQTWTNWIGTFLTFNVENGTPPFRVFVNNNEVLNTTDFNISISDIKQGDMVELKTAVTCEGILSNRIELFDEVLAYPNPTKGGFEIALPSSYEEVQVELYNMQMQLISLNKYPVLFGKVQLNIEDKPAGVYILKVISNKPVILKLIKQ